MTKRFGKLIVLISLVALTNVSSAAIFHYSGTITDGNEPFGNLIPPGTAIEGFFEVSDAAVASGFATERDDILAINFQIGEFCFILDGQCAEGTTTPLILPQAFEIEFDSTGNIAGGILNPVVFSPTFFIQVPITMDFNNDTIFIDFSTFGFLSGSATATSTIPIPAAAWLFISGLLGLSILQRGR